MKMTSTPSTYRSMPGQHAMNPQALRSGYMSSGHWRLASLPVTYVHPIDAPALDVLIELAQKDGVSGRGISSAVDRDAGAALIQRWQQRFLPDP